MQNYGKTFTNSRLHSWRDYVRENRRWKNTFLHREVKHKSKLVIITKVLPTIVLFNDGKAYDRVVGFEELGMKDDFPTINLTRRLVKAKIITAKNKMESGEVSITKKYGRNMNDDDDLDY